MTPDNPIRTNHMSYKRKGEWLEHSVKRNRSGTRGVAGTEGNEPDTAAAKRTTAEWRQLLIQEYGFTAAFAGRLIHAGGVKEEGSRRLLKLFPEEEASEQPEWQPLDILYEDDFCLVVNKPAGMAVHPSQPGQSGTLAHALAAYYEASGQKCRIRHIHRLDEDTTGPVLYAKNEWAHIILDEAMRSKAIGRRYIALIPGKLEPAKGSIDAPIGKDRHHAARRRVSPTGDPAVTHYETVETAPGASCIRLTLETGRTHQIRVHLASRGKPLLGDALYGGVTTHLKRQALHGEALLFPHPWTGDELELQAPWPEDLELEWERLKTGGRT